MNRFSKMAKGTLILLSLSVGCGKKSSSTPPEPGRWQAIEKTESSPSARKDHVAAWVDKRMLIWGGEGASSLGSTEVYDHGSLFDPDDHAWNDLQGDDHTPAARSRHQAVAADNTVIVWGGMSAGQVARSDGAIYDSLAENWTRINRTNAPIGTVGHSMIWTGYELIVWGGGNGGVDVGRSYSLISDTWKVLPIIGAPSARTRHTAVWTGELMIVWGGIGSGTRFNDGAAYNPLTETWLGMTEIIDFEPRSDHTAVWTGKEMIIWGGLGEGEYLGNGARYDPKADEWKPISTAGAPEARASHTAVWTGERMIVWGGEGHLGALATGGIYDPKTDTWLPTALAGSPRARFGHTAVWTGDAMIVWGGWRGLFVPDNAPRIHADGGIFRFP